MFTHNGRSSQLLRLAAYSQQQRRKIAVYNAIALCVFSFVTGAVACHLFFLTP